MPTKLLTKLLNNPYVMGLFCVISALFIYVDFKHGQVDGVTLLSAALFVWCFVETLMALRKK